MGKRSFSVIGAVVLAMTVLAAQLAQAEEVTRESYKEAVEPICKVNADANKRILKGVRKKVKRGKLKAAGRQFAKAGAALKRTRGELAVVPQPPADETRLAKWLGRINREVTLFKKTAAKLKAGNRNAAGTLVIKLQTNARQANNLVLGFEFHYCRFEPSKFT